MQHKRIEKRRQYRLIQMGSKRAKLTISVIQCLSSEIIDLMHSTQSMNTVKEELVKLNGKFELLDELHEQGQKLMELSG